MSVGRKPNTLEETSLRSFTELQSWCEDHSDLQLGLHHFQRVQCQLLPEREGSSSVCGQGRSVAYLGGQFSISALSGSDLYVNPFLLSIIKAEIFLLFYMVLDCSVSCLFILHGNLLLSECLFYGKLWYSVFSCIFS